MKHPSVRYSDKDIYISDDEDGAHRQDAQLNSMVRHLGALRNQRVRVLIWGLRASAGCLTAKLMSRLACLWLSDVACPVASFLIQR